MSPTNNPENLAKSTGARHDPQIIHMNFSEAISWYQPETYKALDQEKIASSIRQDGFNPVSISDPAGYVYPPHRHPETKLLVFLKGSMKVYVQGREFNCSAGDRLMIPGNMEHSAVVGPEGCNFFWSEKL